MTFVFKEYFNNLMMCLFILSLVYIIIIVNFILKIDLEKSSTSKSRFQSFFEIKFEVQFAVIAIMFLLFDIEVLYLFPLISSLYTLSKIILIILIIFQKTRK